jgi:hypothetical protein
MAEQVDNGIATFTTASALVAFRCVKLSSTTDHTVTYAGAGEKSIGVTQQGAASGALIPVKLWSGGGTFRIEAGAAMATRNAVCYAAASGKVSGSASGNPIGRILDVASGDGSMVEVVVENPNGHLADITGLTKATGSTVGSTNEEALAAAALTAPPGGTTGGTTAMENVTGATAVLFATIENNFSKVVLQVTNIRNDLAKVVAKVNEIIAKGG